MDVDRGCSSDVSYQYNLERMIKRQSSHDGGITRRQTKGMLWPCDGAQLIVLSDSARFPES